MDNLVQVRNQVLEDACTMAITSGDEKVIAELCEWALKQAYTGKEVQAKLDEVFTRLKTPQLNAPSQPLAALPSKPQIVHLPDQSTYQSATQSRVHFPTQLETNPAPLEAPDQDSPAEMVNNIVETYKLFDINLKPANPSFITGPRIYQLRFKPAPTTKSLVTSAIEEKLVIHAGLPEKGTIIRPRSGFLEIQVPRKNWESWNLLDHVRGRALTATTPLILPYGIGLDCKVATYETIHALIAGMTQGGKTTFEMALITAAQLWYPPDHLRLVLLDPTKAGFVQNFSNSPWLWNDRVVTDPGEALDVLDLVLLEYEQRGDLFAKHNLTRLEEYNKLKPQSPLPRILVFIDELFALRNPFLPGLGLSDKEAEEENKARANAVDFRLTRGGQEAAKRGIHFFPSTQKPTNKAISTMVRDSMPTKVCFRVASESNGEVVFGNMKDGKMAPQLQRFGDMLISVDGVPERVQGFDIKPADVQEVITKGIRHYGPWTRPRKAGKEDLFVSPKTFTHTPQVEVLPSDPDWKTWQKYQELAKQNLSQTKLLTELYGEHVKAGRAFQKAKADLAQLQLKFGGAA